MVSTILGITSAWKFVDKITKKKPQTDWKTRCRIKIVKQEKYQSANNKSEKMVKKLTNLMSAATNNLQNKV